jgi:integrase
MASIDKRPGGAWRARWREYPGGPQRTRHFSRKLDAERFLVDVAADLQRGAYIDPSAGLVTFEDYAEEWRKIQTHRPSTAAQVESHLRRHVYPTLGARPLASVRPSHVQALVKGLGSSLAPATIETVYRHVAAVFRAAVRDRVIASTPCERIALPRREPRKIEPLAVEAVLALAEAVPDRHRALIEFAAGTGLRQGECFGLTLDRVDMLRRRVTVDRQIDPAGSGAFAPLKTRASYRTVPLPRVVIDALAEHLHRWQTEPDGLVFVDDQGRPLRRNRFGEVWRRARVEVGLPEGVTFHDLRHFYASLLIRHGESVKVVQARLGHASAVETLDTYSHLWPDSEDRTREAVDEVLGAAEDLLRTAEVGR